MPERPFSTTVCHDGGGAVVGVEGDLDLASVPRLSEALDEALGRVGVRRVSVDLSGVDFIDSSGLTSLIKARRRAGDAGVDFVLRSPSERVRRTLELTRLTSVFDVEVDGSG
jgi:anti-sigma B factor antagonist